MAFPPAHLLRPNSFISYPTSNPSANPLGLVLLCSLSSPSHDHSCQDFCLRSTDAPQFILNTASRAILLKCKSYHVTSLYKTSQWLPSESKLKFIQGPSFNALHTLEPLSTSLIPSLTSPSLTLLWPHDPPPWASPHQAGSHPRAFAHASPSIWKASFPLTPRAHVLISFRSLSIIYLSTCLIWASLPTLFRILALLPIFCSNIPFSPLLLCFSSRVLTSAD